MSTENFDHGSNKANGRVIIGADAAASTVTGSGLGPAIHVGTGVITLTILEAIAQEEFLCVAGREGKDGQVCVSWLSPNSFTIEISDEAGAAADGEAWFIVYRAATGAVVITDGPE